MRRHDLDWLRVLVFGLLIFYHVGMLFVPWGFHIKNNIIYEWIKYPMWFLNQWRLPILFVISGMGTYFALSRRTGKQFAWERLKRLYIPLIIGMILVIPPQVYIERIVSGQFHGNYFDFWFWEAFSGIYPSGNFSWHHLWFLPYLLVYSLLLTPLFIYLRRHAAHPVLTWIKKISGSPLGIYLFIIPLYLLETLLEPFFPVTHALIDDWFNFTNGLVLFFYGFLLISHGESFWHTVQIHRRQFLLAGILGFSSMLLLVESFDDSTARHFTEGFLKVFNLWSWILAIFGYAYRYLNKPSKILAYCNQAVYPFYILHQTTMMIIAFFLIERNMSFIGKSSALILGTFGITWLIYELMIRRWTPIRPLFGLKQITVKP